MDTGDAKNVHQRLAAVMGEVDYIQKEKKQGMNYTIVSHDAVTAKVRPVLLKHGIVYYPVRCEHHHDGNRAECAMTIRFVNIDYPTDFFDVPTFGYGIDNQDKGPGKAMSYAVKYALLKALGLETGDDPENESIPHEAAPKEKKNDAARAIFAKHEKAIRSATDKAELRHAWNEALADRDKLTPDWEKTLVSEKNARLAEIEAIAGNGAATSNLDRVASGEIQ